MVYGGLPVEHIQFNEDTVWTGSHTRMPIRARPRRFQRCGGSCSRAGRWRLEGLKNQKEAAQLRADGKAQEADAKHKEAQDLLKTADAKQRQAQELGMKEFMSVPLHQMAYQPCGDLRIEFPGQDKAADYRRWLDLDRGVAAVEYRCEGVTFLRELFVWYPDHALFARVTADQPGKLNCVVRLTSPHKRSTVTAQDGTLVLEGEVQEGGIRFQSRLVAVPQGGTVAAEKDALRVTGATSVVIRLVAGTNFKNFRDLSADPAERCAEDAKRSRGKSWDQVMAAHVADHQALFRRVSLDLGRSAAAGNPTDHAWPNSGPATTRTWPPWSSSTAAICSLPAAPGRPAGQPARHLERQPQPPVGQQIHLQHQHRDELLAGRACQPRRLRRAAL